MNLQEKWLEKEIRRLEKKGKKQRQLKPRFITPFLQSVIDHDREDLRNYGKELKKIKEKKEKEKRGKKA